MNKISKETLIQMYEVDGKPMHTIAKELNVAIGTVFNYCKKYEINVKDAKTSFTMKGRKLSKERCLEMSKQHKGKTVSDETREKISFALTKGGIGHKKKRSDGYIAIYFPDHPQSTKDGYILEHVLVAECILGRHLKDDEVVHHKNHIRSDNRKENLQVMTFSEHASLHMKERHNKRRNDLLTKQF